MIGTGSVASTVSRTSRCGTVGDDGACRIGSVAQVRLFASAREAAGTGSDVIDGDTVGDVLRSAVDRYGDRFESVLSTCRVWVNGDDAAADTPLGPNDELAVLPPVSGGAT